MQLGPPVKVPRAVMWDGTLAGYGTAFCSDCAWQRELRPGYLYIYAAKNPKPRLQDYGHDVLLGCASTKGMWSAVVALLGKTACISLGQGRQPGYRCYNTSDGDRRSQLLAARWVSRYLLTLHRSRANINSLMYLHLQVRF